MEERNDDIGKLFKNAFTGHKVPPSNEEWEMLNSSLTKHNFFKFNPYQFNIYYASTIVVCFFICVGVGSHYTYKHFVEPIFTQTIQIQTSVESGDSIPNVSSKELGPIQEVKPAYEKNITVASHSLKDKSISIVVDQEIQVNTSHQLAKSDSSSHFHPPNVSISIVDSVSGKDKPYKRTLYITKRDTIFRFDTVKTPKRQRRWPH